jgi:hypothetical protein
MAVIGRSFVHVLAHVAPWKGGSSCPTGRLLRATGCAEGNKSTTPFLAFAELRHCLTCASDSSYHVPADLPSILDTTMQSGTTRRRSLAMGEAQAAGCSVNVDP